MDIPDASFVVVDTETTGIRAGDDRLIEIAGVRVEGGEIVDRYAQLISPGRAVPRRITELTGISTAMLYGQPDASEVLPRFLEFLGDSVFVAHNLPFDLGFINAELAQIGRPELGSDTVCTLRLARRLLPGLRSKGLASLADFYGIQIQGRHRALGDAEATAQVLLRLLEKARLEHGVVTLDELLTFQNRRYRDLKEQARHLRRIREEVLPTLPSRPGVYFMRDRRGGVVYIGKAKSLRARVRSYFTAVEAHPERTRRLVDAVRDVTWEETGSELGALLLESRLIKEHQPRFNRAQRRYRTRPFLRLDTTHACPRVTSTNYLLNDGAEYFGPLGGRRQAELVVDLVNRFFKLRECEDDAFARGRPCMYAEMGRCTAPCRSGEGGDAYAAELQRVRDFLMGQDRSILDELEAAMKEAAGRLAFEEATQYRDWIRNLERMLDRQQFVAAPVLAHNAVLSLPSAVEGRTQLVLVRFGRHVETIEVARPPTIDDLAHLRDRLAVHFDPDREEPDRYFKREIDEIRILANWMYLHRDSTAQVTWEPGRSVDALLRDVVDVVTSQPGPEDA